MSSRERCGCREKIKELEVDELLSIRRGGEKRCGEGWCRRVVVDEE